MFIYLAKGKLPWSGLKVKDIDEKYRKIGEMKSATDPSDLCKGYPGEFITYMHYTRGLPYDERPDYEKMLMLMRKVRQKHCPDFMERDLDWLKGQDLKPL